MEHKTIHVDMEVYGQLQHFAGLFKVPFTSPNNILRIILGLTPHEGIAHRPSKETLEELLAIYKD